MPARPKRSSALIKKQKQLGHLQKSKAEVKSMEAKQEAVDEEKRQVREKLMESEGELLLFNQELGAIEHKVSYKSKKLREMKESLGKVTTEMDEVQQEESKKHCLKITTRLKKNRKRNATRAGLNHTQACKRRKETWKVGHILHGGTNDNPEATLHGLYGTICAKETSEGVAKRIMAGKSSVVEPLKKGILQKWTKSYLKSDDNIKRSMNLYYAGSPAGKRKYEQMRRAGRKAVHDGVRMPNLVPYKMLSSFINKIDIGALYDVNPKLTTDKGGPSSAGRYRNARDYIPRLAKFYLEADTRRADKLHQFPHYESTKHDSDSFVMVMAIGGDGAPCGTTVLVNFLNIGERIPCSDETYLLFGTDDGESAPVVREYLKVLVEDLIHLESKVFTIEVHGVMKKVEFRVGLIPNDMKMMAFLAGEMNNNAHFFTTYAIVSKDDYRMLGYTFGDGPNDQWKPFTYAKRLEDAKKVAAFKEKEDTRKVTEETKKQNIGRYTAQLRSRQKEEPLIGKFVDRAVFEPLHGKNNSIKELFIKLMHVASNNSNYGNVKEYSNLPDNNLFVKVVQFVRRVMGCNMLSTKMQSWFNDHGGKCDNKFGYRFQGQESRAFLRHFPELCWMLLPFVPTEDQKLVLIVHHQAVLLRRLVSASVRITNIDTNIIKKSKEDGQLLHKSCVLFDPSLTPTTWCFANVMPEHSATTYKKFGFGLGCNTMEGREQKHQKIAKYQRQTTWQGRWDMTFRHEYVSLIYLRENGFDRIKYRKKGKKYVPEVSVKHCPSCVGFLRSDGTCGLCDHVLMKDIREKLAKPPKALSVKPAKGKAKKPASTPASTPAAKKQTKSKSKKQ